MFFRLGQLASMCLVQGGGGFHVLSETVYEYISGRDIADVIAHADEISDSEVRAMVDKVRQVAISLM